ncbi:hypothetical protein FB45DRAFT_1044466 [Roridomyces roridus]|uniref:F-box domain-containing protein n=1 Tax=Roridomyces roridus TaxID=1738132 RepID=A0AAD7AY08_9AGAR|nr:hypothetical protein FB45DRAFT_1044466 [Roridomyces roridus]
MSPTSPPPILLLPDELLIEIAAVQPQKSLTPEPPSEWVLSHVCSRFRRAVTGAAALWTRIVVDLCCDTSAELFRLYLERSGVCEMDATLRAMDSDLPAAPKGLQYLSPHVGRIARLTIIVEARQALETILSSLPNVAMPALQHLEIENSSDRDIDLLDLSPLKLPNITSLKMTRCTPSFPPPQWMRALTHLHLEDNPYPVRENSDIFQFITMQHPSLVYLYLDLMKAIFPLGSGIVSQSLTHLDLQFNEGEKPWPELDVLAIRPRPAEIENGYTTLQEVVCWKRSQQESLPTFKLSANLFEREFWAENGVVVELLEEYSMIGSVF